MRLAARSQLAFALAHTAYGTDDPHAEVTRGHTFTALLLLVLMAARPAAIDAKLLAKYRIPLL